METIKVTRKQAKGRPSRLSEQQKDTVVRRFNCGDTQQEIADAFNVSRSTVQRVLSERR
jgi:transposase